MELNNPELAPISEDQPAGTDVRYEAEFEKLQAEIDKLSLPSATGGVEWEKVRSLASLILQNQSKDLLVAGYFAAAEIRVNGLSGFAAGMEVFGGLLETYWETLFPPKKRMRGRIAAVNWWLEKCETALSEVSVDPLAPEQAEGLRVSLQRLDELLQQCLDEAPLLRPLERIIDEFPLADSVAETAAEPAPVKEETAETEASPKSAGAEPQDNKNKEKKAVAAAPQKRQPVKVESPPEVSSIEGMSGTDMEKILRAALQTVRQAGDFYFDKDLTNPRGYRCRRVAGWTLIQAVPPSTNNQTQIPPPGECEEMKIRLGEYRALGKWQEILRESEFKLGSSLLWLDLNRFSAESLEGLGSQYQDACEAVCQETSFLLTRLPGLEKLKFADGTPLADADTRQWIEGIRPGSGAEFQATAPAGGELSERIDSVMEQAKSLATAKKLSEAFSLMTEQLQRSCGGHEQLLWRLGLAQLLMSYKQNRLALPHLEEVLEEIEHYRVEEWEPSLAIYALKIVWLGFRTDKSFKDAAEGVLKRVARLDPVEAMRLEKK